MHAFEVAAVDRGVAGHVLRLLALLLLLLPAEHLVEEAELGVGDGGEEGEEEDVEGVEGTHCFVFFVFELVSFTNVLGEGIPRLFS